MVSDKNVHRAFRTHSDTTLQTTPIREIFNFHQLPKIYIGFKDYQHSSFLSFFFQISISKPFFVAYFQTNVWIDNHIYICFLFYLLHFFFIPGTQAISLQQPAHRKKEGTQIACQKSSTTLSHLQVNGSTSYFVY